MLAIAIELIYNPELATGDVPTGSLAPSPKSGVSHLTEKQKRRMRLQIANPKPNAEGVIVTSISLYHAERPIRRNAAVRINENGEPDKDGGWLMWLDTDFERKLVWGPKIPVRDLPMCMSNLTGTSLWPVIPNYTEGRPLEDFLTLVNRSKRSSNGSEGKQ